MTLQEYVDLGCYQGRFLKLNEPTPETPPTWVSDFYANSTIKIIRVCYLDGDEWRYELGTWTPSTSERGRG